MPTPKVLIVTGTLVSAKERSFKQFWKKQVDSFKASSGAWLDTQLKVVGAENITAQARYMKSKAFRRATYHSTVSKVFGQDWNFGAPELTEVALMTLLAKEGIQCEAITYGELYGDEVMREKLLAECGCVFASTTLLRDLSELDPLMRILKRDTNKVVVGGSLTSILHHDFNGSPFIDVFTVGYGEMLVPSLAAWIRSGYSAMKPPETGRVLQKGQSIVLYSGVPESKNLDFIDAPDWSLAEAYHKKNFEMVHYESVRGCPYRCSFCNYPFLFDDTKFRYKSAEKIVDDWEVYYKNGARYITCLDSLFTVPPKRLKRVCELLIERKIDIKWICYARADDLTDLATCQLMRDAGCIQVQIGVESGSQEILDNMNKRCTVEQNALAIQNCRKVGITSLATVIIGFPGDTVENLKKTLAFLKENPPDFYYSAPFNTRVEYIPILNEANRKRFGILTNQGATSSAPYWKHNSMSSTELGAHIRWFNEQVMSQKISLEGTLFYKIILNYDPRTRLELLNYQYDVLKSYPGMRRIFKWVFDFTQRKLEKDVTRVLGNGAEKSAASVHIPIQPAS